MLVRAPARGCVWSGTSWQKAVLVCAPETTEEQTSVGNGTLLSLVCRHQHSPNTRTSSYQATAHQVQDSIRCRKLHRTVPGRTKPLWEDGAEYLQ